MGRCGFRSGNICSRQSKAEAQFDLQTTRYSLVGHSHLPFRFEEEPGTAPRLVIATDGESLALGEGRCIFNPGSVGQPRDGDPRASYLLYDESAATSPGTGSITTSRRRSGRCARHICRSGCPSASRWASEQHEDSGDARHMSWTVVGQDSALAVLRRGRARSRGARLSLRRAGAHGQDAGGAAVRAAPELHGRAAAMRPLPRSASMRLRGSIRMWRSSASVGFATRANTTTRRMIRATSASARYGAWRSVVSRAPFEGRRRVIIIEPADAPGSEATANALLKTLEEPPPYGVVRS